MKIGYARVSRQDQNLELQTTALNDAGAERIYSDRISGAKADRIGLDEMLRHLRNGDTVIVWRLDRLARSLKHLIEIAADFAARGVQLVSMKESIDTSAPAGKMIFHIFGAIAEFERDLIRERTGAGLEVARSKGNVGGRRPVLDADKQNAIDLLVEKANKEERPVRIKDIAHSIGVSDRTVRRYLRSDYSPKKLAA